MRKSEEFYKTPRLKTAQYLFFHYEEIVEEIQDPDKQNDQNLTNSKSAEEHDKEHPLPVQGKMKNYEGDSEVQGSRQAENEEKQISKIINFDEHESEDRMATPKRTPLLTEDRHTTASKKLLPKRDCNDYPKRYDIHENECHDYTLRNLAKLAERTVISCKNPVSYKQVAEMIIRQSERPGEQINEKQKININRRVYDALNVLIALEKLKKEGKNIIRDPQQEEHERKRAEWKNSIQERIRLKKEKIACFRSVISGKKKSLRGLSAITRRNRGDTADSNTQITIRLPFLIISSQSLMTLSSDSSKMKMILNRNSPTFLGDLQGLALLNV